VRGDLVDVQTGRKTRDVRLGLKRDDVLMMNDIIL